MLVNRFWVNVTIFCTIHGKKNNSAQATASTAGSTAGASGGLDDVESVSPGYYKGMAVFIIATGGLMFEASVGGQRFSYRPIAQDAGI